MSIKLYYKQGLEFAMREFISKTIKKYIEFMQDDGATENQIKLVEGVMQSFENWLYLTLKS